MKTNPKNPAGELQAIREIMERSSRFLSLSGLAGIFAGVCALIGAAIAWFIILEPGRLHYAEFIHMSDGSSDSGPGLYLAMDALLVLVLAVSGAVWFSYRKARRAGQKLWTPSTRHLIINVLIPLASGGVFILILVLRSNLELVAPAMLIFYGLALVNAGKFTFGEIQSLGLTQIGLGLLSGFSVNHGLLLWAIGFGLMHIVYGTLMYYRHERPQPQPPTANTQ